MKGYWHIPAFATVCATLFIYFKSFLFILLFLAWIGTLFFLKRLEKQHVIVSLTFLLLFLLYIPDKDTSNKNMHTEKENFHGQIISSITKNNQKIEFKLKEYDTKQQYTVIYFPKQEAEENIGFLKYGATCNIKGKLELPNERRNPGQFDFRSYLMKQGIYYQIIVNSLDQISCEGYHPLNHLFIMRSNLLSKVENKLSPFTASWLNSLVLGDDSSLDEETLMLFQKWGLTHIIAISGTHIALLLSFLYLVLIKFSILTKEKAQWFVVLFLPIYAVLAGGEPSVWRSCIMAVILILLRKLKMTNSVLDVISIVFIGLLLINPYYIYHVGFQFSFLVTFCIFLSRKWLSHSQNSLMQGLKVSFIAQMIILPLQFNYFSFFQPLSILLNVFIIPYFSIIVIPLMYSLLPLSLLSISYISFIDYVFIKLHAFVLQFISWFDSIFDSPWLLGSVSIGSSFIYMVILLYFMKEIELKRLKTAFVSGIILCCFLFILIAKPYFSPVGKVTMLDIGQGDAMIIELPYRKGVIMIDAGASFSFSEGTVSKNVYKGIIKPFLYSQGIHKLDALILTHEDLDHVGSAPFLIEEGIVQRIYVHSFYEPSEIEAELWKGFQVEHIGRGDVLEVNGQILYILGPDQKADNSNDNSIVILTEIGGLNWLFTGDIGVEKEKEIINNYPNLKVDVLKVGHHGSHTSTDEAILEKLHPQIALISVGENNRYGHPSPEVIKRLQEKNITILRTDLHGAIEFRFGINAGTFSTFLPYSNHE